jgi:hypothetical protein
MLVNVSRTDESSLPHKCPEAIELPSNVQLLGFILNIKLMFHISVNRSKSEEYGKVGTFPRESQCIRAIGFEFYA